ncbi:MAG: hypothetical protein KJ630_00120 [Proteobacteria bacterium]|nr:hypothetical protein [Pseudomonadota bacterium]
MNGCIPYSDNPLTAPDNNGPDPAILGTWFMHEKGETVFLHMGIDEKTKGLRLVMVEFQKDGEVKTSELIGHTSRLGSYTYMNLLWDRPAEPEAGYLFVKYQIVGERIGLGLIRSDAVEKAVREGSIRGIIDETQKTKFVQLTDSAEQLREYVQKHDAELFEELQWMNRWDPLQCPGLSSAGKNEDRVTIKKRPELFETVYSLGNESCELSLTAYESELNLGVVTVRSNCGLSWKRQLSLFEKGLTKVLEDEKQARAFRALSWGRLAPDQRVPHEMSYRLALAAFESPLWDKKRGRPKTGHENNFVEELANKANIYSEIKLIFDALNLSLGFSHAEKVLVMEAGKLPFFDALSMHGVQTKDKLPFDCQAWFSVSSPKRQ